MRYLMIESQRIRTKKSKDNIQRDHIADRGRVSMLHFNMVHKPIPIPKAMKTPGYSRQGTDKIAEATGLGRVQSDQ